MTTEQTIPGQDQKPVQTPQIVETSAENILSNEIATEAIDNNSSLIKDFEDRVHASTDSAKIYDGAEESDIEKVEKINEEANLEIKNLQGEINKKIEDVLSVANVDNLEKTRVYENPEDDPLILGMEKEITTMVRNDMKNDDNYKNADPSRVHRTMEAYRSFVREYPQKAKAYLVLGDEKYKDAELAPTWYRQLQTADQYGKAKENYNKIKEEYKVKDGMLITLDGRQWEVVDDGSIRGGLAIELRSTDTNHFLRTIKGEQYEDFLTELNKNKSEDKKVEDPLERFGGDKKKMESYYKMMGGEYVTGVPIENSIVRMELQNKILEDLKPGTPIIIEAYSRQGKTSMLKTLGNRLEENGQPPIFIDTQKSQGDWGKLPIEEFQKEFGQKEIRNYIEDYLIGINIDEMEGKNPFDFLDESLQKQGKEVVIEIDELIKLTQNDPIQLIAVCENLKRLKNIKAVMAWHPFDNLAEISNNAFKDCERLSIKPLDFEDVKKLIEQPLKDKDSNISFSDEAIQTVLDYTGGRPMDVNIFLSDLMGSDLRGNQLYKIQYGGRDIENFIKGIDGQEFDIFTVAREAVFKDVFRLLDSGHKEILNKIVENGGKLELSQLLPSDAEDLINLGLIRNEHNSYKINGEIISNFIKELKSSDFF